MTALPAPWPAQAGGATDGSRGTVALLRVDASLREAVPPDARRLADRVLVVPRRELGEGQWAPETLLGDSDRPFAALLLRGLVTHDVVLAGRSSTNLLGPGDLFRPWRWAETSVPCEVRWAATGGAAIAVLDERFLAGARRWPELAAVVHERLAEQLEVAAVRAAILGLPRVEQRLLALFWQLADRWGVVRPEGVVVELALTHAFLGHLIGSRRPTVSLALQALAEDGHLRRDPAGAWVLAHDSRAALALDADDRRIRCARPPRREVPAAVVAADHPGR